MSIATVKNNSVLELIGLKNEEPIKNKIIVNVANVFGSDGKIQKAINKINVNGNNPFGSVNVKDDEKSLKEGISKKLYLSFDSIDSDKNGFLSHKEIVNKMKDNSIKGQTASLISSLVETNKKISNLSNDEIGIENNGITKKDLIALDKLENSDSIKEKVENTYYNSLYKASSGKSFFDKNGNFILPQKTSDIDFKSVQQGGAGDCYFLAALASQAQHNPQKIVDMIKDNGDGTYNIKFSNKTVKITTPTDSELGLYADGAGWVALIEKGYAVYRNETALIKRENPFDVSGGGSIIIGRGIKELTGNSFETNSLLLTTKKTTRSKLEKATANGSLMTASINKHIIGKSDFNLPDGHVYTILSFDSKADKVKIRNPWGHTEAQDNKGNTIDNIDDGIFELTIDDFFKAFSMIAYEKK